MTPDRHPWDVTLPTSGQKRLADLLRALVVTRSTMTDSDFFGGELTLRTSIEFRVHVPEGREMWFENVGGCTLRRPPQPHI